jgi:hypothetical protein
MRAPLHLALLISPIYLLLPMTLFKKSYNRHIMLSISTCLGNSKPQVLVDVEIAIWKSLLSLASGMNEPFDVLRQLSDDLPWDNIHGLSSMDSGWFDLSLLQPSLLQPSLLQPSLLQPSLLQPSAQIEALATSPSPAKLITSSPPSTVDPSPLSSAVAPPILQGSPLTADQDQLMTDGTKSAFLQHKTGSMVPSVGKEDKVNGEASGREKQRSGVAGHKDYRDPPRDIEMDGSDHEMDTGKATKLGADSSAKRPRKRIRIDSDEEAESDHEMDTDKTKKPGAGNSSLKKPGAKNPPSLKHSSAKHPRKHTRSKNYGHEGDSSSNSDEGDSSSNSDEGDSSSKSNSGTRVNPINVDLYVSRWEPATVKKEFVSIFHSSFSMGSHSFGRLW